MEQEQYSLERELFEILSMNAILRPIEQVADSLVINDDISVLINTPSMESELPSIESVRDQW